MTAAHIPDDGAMTGFLTVKVGRTRLRHGIPHSTISCGVGSTAGVSGAVSSIPVGLMTRSPVRRSILITTLTPAALAARKARVMSRCRKGKGPRVILLGFPSTRVRARLPVARVRIAPDLKATNSARVSSFEPQERPNNAICSRKVAYARKDKFVGSCPTIYSPVGAAARGHFGWDSGDRAERAVQALRQFQ
jgi:hypothetical protein